MRKKTVAALRRKPPQCTATRADGERCTSFALTQDGITSLQARGVGLVAAPQGLCSYHARDEASRRQFQSQGGTESAKRFHAPKAEPEPDLLPVDVKLNAYTLIRGLI